MIWNCSTYRFDSQMPILMGILNVTPDSFSDGGRYDDPEKALAHAHEMIEQGALIIDVGGESTRPGAEPVTEEAELARVLDIVRTLASEGVCVSIDTRHASVARACVEAGASIINDVSGFRDPAMVEVAQSCDAGLVVMHMGGDDPRTMQDDTTYIDVVAEVRDYLSDRASELEIAGIAHDRICLDPGPGFGKNARQTIQLLRNMHEFVHLGYPVMVAASRKSFLRSVYQVDDEQKRDEASCAEALMACELGASVIRVHNVAMMAQTIKDNLRPYALIGAGCNVPLVAEEGEELEGKKAMLNKAIGDMCMMPDTEVIDVAPFYESEPAYKTDQDTFVNTVVLLRTGLPPQQLLKYLQAIENSLGRVRGEKNGPRTCDLDILDYQGYASDLEVLTLPHPLLVERDFVVKPLFDLVPGHILADGTHIDPAKATLGKAWRC